MRTVVVADAEAAGDLLARQILVGVAAGPFVLGCPAGRTPLTTYRALGRLAAEHRTDLGGLTLAMMDEYVLADGELCDPRAHFSCRRFATDVILPALDCRVSPGSVVFPTPGEDPPRSDLFLLASGASDGHVAFNGPGSALGSRTRIVDLADTTRRDNLATFPDFRDLSEVPPRGLTVGLAAVTAAREAVLVLLGRDKAESFRRVTGAGGFDPAWPATVVHACAGAWILADEAAAA